MKIKIIKDSTVTETEITVKCAAVDENLKRLLDELEHNNAKLTGRIDDKTFLISAEMIYYIESVDEKTFILDFNKTDFERLINGETVFDIIDQKYQELLLDISFEEYIKKHPNEDELEYRINCLKYEMDMA